ncbi:ATP synthase F1 subunit delta, partial [Staphylococcus warneri]
MSSTAASSYANALADVAKSNNTLDRTFADVEKIEKLFSEESVLRFFTNPTIVDVEKRGIIDEIARSAALQPHVANFLSILVDMKRIDLVKEIVKEFEVVYNILTATELAVVTSVVK